MSVVCGAASCVDGVHTPETYCTGSETGCPLSPTPCTPYVCDSDGLYCLSDCAADGDDECELCYSRVGDGCVGDSCSESPHHTGLWDILPRLEEPERGSAAGTYIDGLPRPSVPAPERGAPAQDSRRKACAKSVCS